MSEQTATATVAANISSLVMFSLLSTQRLFSRRAVAFRAGESDY